MFLLAALKETRMQEQYSTLCVLTVPVFLPEPNAYRSMVGRAINSTQLAQDYTQLRTLLQSVRYYNRAHLYGPNAGRPRRNAILLLDGSVKITHTTEASLVLRHTHAQSHTCVYVFLDGPFERLSPSYIMSA